MLFQNFLFLKEFLAWNGYFWLLKMGLGLAFVAHFLYDFSIKIIFIYSINGQSFNVIPLFLPKISNKMCYLSSYLDSYDVINFNICLGSTSKAMADQEKKRGRQKCKN